MPRSAEHPTTANFLDIDINRLRRWGGLDWGRRGQITWRSGASVNYRRVDGGLRLTYSHGRTDRVDVDELVPIVFSATKFGGRRAWFECPGCHRRCGDLYGGQYFRCRLCVGARYESQRCAPMTRLLDRRWALRRRLEDRGGAKAGLFGLDDGLPPKPKRMRWTTYRRLERQDEALERIWLGAAAQWMAKQDRRRDRRFHAT
jgi:hypothetical protein